MKKHGNVTKLVYEDLTYQIRGACFEVYKALGPLHKEAIYHLALKKELKLRKIPFQSEKDIPIKYKNEKVGIYRPDFIIDNKIILEIKATPSALKIFEKQLFFYLNNSCYKLAMLVNFGALKRVYIRRWLLK